MPSTFTPGVDAQRIEAVPWIKGKFGRTASYGLTQSRGSGWHGKSNDARETV